MKKLLTHLLTSAVLFGPLASIAHADETLQPLAQAAAMSHAPDEPEDAGHKHFAVQILAVNAAHISAPMAGRLVTLPLRDGDSFHKGDLLAAFDCLLAGSQHAHALAEVQKYQALVETQNNLRQLRSWSTSDYRTTQADLAAARADLGVTDATLANCTVRAPFDGTVTELPSHQDQFLTLGQPLISINDPRRLEISFLIPSRSLAHHPLGTHFSVSVDETGESYAATLTRVSGAADPVSRTIRVYATIDSAHPGLLPGMTGDAGL